MFASFCRFLLTLCILTIPALASTPFDSIIPGNRNLSLTFAGDLMAHIPNYSYQPFEELYRGVQDIIQTDDLSFVNLEFPVDDTKQYSSFPLFNVHTEYPWAAVMAGFDVFSLANNHAADQGPTGVFGTTTALNNLQIRAQQLHRNIWYNGLRLYPDTPPWTITTINIKGLKIGFVALAEWVNIPSLKNYVQYVDCRETPPPTAFLNWLQSIRPSVDLLVLSYHWGDEYIRSQNQIRAEFSRKLVEAGVDILWGNHPHVLQPWYTLPSKRGTALVLPSMGNFVSGQNWEVGPNPLDERAPRGDSALFKVNLSVDFAGHVEIQKTDPVLISTWTNEKGQMVARTLDDLAQNLTGLWQQYYLKRREIMQKFYLHPLDAPLR